jgi:hypothetical protein
MDLAGIFGKSPFEPMVQHAKKVHDCVALVPLVAQAMLSGRMDELTELQHQMSKTEYEADQIKDHIRQGLPARYFLPVNREDMTRFLAQMDQIADDAEDFAVVATFRRLEIPKELHADFMALVNKVMEVSTCLLSMAEQLGQLQRHSFAGPDADEMLLKVQEIAHMEWESDKLNRKFARQYFNVTWSDPATIVLLDKMCRSLGGIADHAENVAKNLRLMILRK